MTTLTALDRQVDSLASQVANLTNEDVITVITVASRSTKSIDDIIDNLVSLLQVQIDLFIEENPELFATESDDATLYDVRQENPDFVYDSK